MRYSFHTLIGLESVPLYNTPLQVGDLPAAYPLDHNARLPTLGRLTTPLASRGQLIYMTSSSLRIPRTVLFTADEACWSETWTIPRIPRHVFFYLQPMVVSVGFGSEPRGSETKVLGFWAMK